MHKLYELKEALCDELESYASRGLNRQSIPEIDMLAHACKNICKIIEFCEDSEQQSMGGMSFRNNYSRRYPRYSYNPSYMEPMDTGMGYSYDNRERMNTSRNSMGQYSGHDQAKIAEIANDLRKIADKLPDTYKGEIMRLSEKMHNLEE